MIVGTGNSLDYRRAVSRVVQVIGIVNDFCRLKHRRSRRRAMRRDVYRPPETWIASQSRLPAISFNLLNGNFCARLHAALALFRGVDRCTSRFSSSNEFIFRV